MPWLLGAGRGQGVELPTCAALTGFLSPEGCPQTSAKETTVPLLSTRRCDSRTSAPSHVVLLLVGQESLLVVEGLAADGAAEGAVPDVAPAVGDEVGLLAKAALTVGAGVGPLPGVDAPVGHQVGLLAEGFAAVGADIGLLAGVDPPVGCQVGLVAESLAAVGADERPFGGVVAPVGGQVAALGEAAPTLFADKGPLASVDPGVRHQVSLLAEVLAALGAGEGPLPGVLALMRAQETLEPEAPAAVVAAVEQGGGLRLVLRGFCERLPRGLRGWPLSCLQKSLRGRLQGPSWKPGGSSTWSCLSRSLRPLVDLAVGQQVGFVTEAAAALSARVRFFAGVDAPVRSQVGLVGEALPAFWALVRPLARMHAAVGDQVGLVAKALAAARTLEGAVYCVPTGSGGGHRRAAPGPGPQSLGCCLLQGLGYVHALVSD